MSFTNTGFDVRAFIEEIKKRPAVWDIASKLYRNRVARNGAWNEVCRLYAPNFEEKSEADKILLEKDLQKKWRYLRDAYTRLIRDGNQKYRNYVYAKELSFLNKNAMKDFEGSSNFSDEDDDSIPIQRKSLKIRRRLAYTPNVPIIKKRRAINGDSPVKERVYSTQGSRRSKIFRKPVSTSSFQIIKRKMKPVNVAEVREIRESEEEAPVAQEEMQGNSFQSKENDDMTFFRSLLPALSTVHLSQKLLFRIDVMRLLHQYTQGNSQTSVPQTEHFEISHDQQIESTGESGDTDAFCEDEYKIVI